MRTWPGFRGNDDTIDANCVQSFWAAHPANVFIGVRHINRQKGPQMLLRLAILKKAFIRAVTGLLNNDRLVLLKK